MYAKNAYLRPVSQPRVDLILEVFERLLARLRLAQSLLETQPEEARRLLNQCQLAVTGMAVGQDLSLGELAGTFVRLYEFITHSISKADGSGIGDAIDVLQTLQSGFVEIRADALNMERAGQIPSLDQARLQVTA